MAKNGEKVYLRAIGTLKAAGAPVYAEPLLNAQGAILGLPPPPPL